MLKAEKIVKDGELLAIILRSVKTDNAVEFITPKEFGLQFGVHNRKKGDYVKSHSHVPFEMLENLSVQELLYVRKGKLSVGLFHKNKFYKKIIVNSDEFIVLNTGHNVKFLEDTEMVEVKQGPYREKENEKKNLE